MRWNAIKLLGMSLALGGLTLLFRIADLGLLFFGLALFFLLVEQHYDNLRNGRPNVSSKRCSEPEPRDESTGHSDDGVPANQHEEQAED